VRNILKNPAYAGAYVYGRRCAAPERRSEGGKNPTRAVPREQWEVCIQNAHPAYISWETHMAISDTLADNVGNFKAGHRGMPRKGKALLQGIAMCGSCGRRMALNYSGPDSTHPVYRCRSERATCTGQYCQEVRAPRVEAEVERQLLAALAPDRLAITLAALDAIDADIHGLERQWTLKRERAEYECERARRQYDAVEPENRLVARSLEATWESKLRDVEKIEQDYRRWKKEQTTALSTDDRARIAAFGIDLPDLWQRIENSQRKAMLRLVIDKVILDQRRAKGMVWIRIVWQTGAATEHWVMRKTQSYAESAHADVLEQRIREFNGAGMMDARIADALNAEGLRNSLGGMFDHNTVHLLRRRWNIPTVKINGVEHNPLRWSDGSYSIQGAALALGIT
jgi:hypothetical protein